MTFELSSGSIWISFRRHKTERRDKKYVFSVHTQIVLRQIKAMVFEPKRLNAKQNERKIKNKRR